MGLFFENVRDFAAHVSHGVVGYDRAVTCEQAGVCGLFYLWHKEGRKNRCRVEWGRLALPATACSFAPPCCNTMFHVSTVTTVAVRPGIAFIVTPLVKVRPETQTEKPSSQY